MVDPEALVLVTTVLGVEVFCPHCEYGAGALMPLSVFFPHLVTLHPARCEALRTMLNEQLESNPTAKWAWNMLQQQYALHERAGA